MITLNVANAAQEQPSTLSSTLFGVGVHVIGHERDVQGITTVPSQSGVTSVRLEAQWSFVEATKDHLAIPSELEAVVNKLVSKSITVLMILDYGNKFYDKGDKPRSPEALAAFARYAGFVVDHFRGRVKYYEVWNEWDVSTGGSAPGTPEDYAKLFDAALPAIKKADPSANVLICAGLHGVASFWAPLAKLGTVSKADGVAIHPYNNEKAFGPETSIQYVTELEQSMVALTGRPSVNLYITEVGWPGTLGLTESQLAEYVSRTTLLAASLHFVKGIWWYELKDDGTDSSNKEHTFGLLHFDWTPKATWAAYVDAIAFANAHRLVLGADSDLRHRRAVIAIADSTDTQETLAWSLLENAPPFLARCAHGSGSRSTNSHADHSEAAAASTYMSLGRSECVRHPVLPGRISQSGS